MINNGFGPHESLEVMQFYHENNIVLCQLPSHTSHTPQPCDVGVFGPLKTAYRERIEELYRGRANTVGKQHFTSQTKLDRLKRPKHVFGNRSCWRSAVNARG